MKNSFYTIKYVIIIIVLSFTQWANSQTDSVTYTVKGLVRDAHTKEPIPAAVISVPNIKETAIGDFDGVFEITLPSGDEVLHVEAFDYGKMEIPVQGRNYIEIDLYSQEFPNYFKKVLTPTGSINNSALPMSISSQNDIITITDVTVDGVIQAALSGDVKTVSRTGLSAVGNTMFIRGYNSLNVNAQPLIVVDGIVRNDFDVNSIHKGLFYNSLADIDVNDIENVSVLKDGTSIYGSKAANGVILITTKRGKSQATKIGVNMFYGMSETPSITPMMNGDEYRIFASEMMKTSPVASAFLGNPADSRNNAYYNNTDWSDEVYQTGSTSNLLVNVDGGDDRAQYYFSMGYTKSDELVKTTDLQRLNARFNVDAKLTNRIDMGINMAYSRIERTLVDDGIDYYSSPTWQAQIKSPFLSPYEFNDAGEETKRYASVDLFGIGNPSGILDNSQNKHKKYQYNLGVKPVIQLLPGLSLSTQFDYSQYNIDEAYFLPIDYSPERYIENKGISKNRLQSQVVSNKTVYDDTRLTFEKTMNTHSVKALAGFRYQVNNSEMDYIEEHNSGSNTNTMITGNYDFKNAYGINNQTRSISSYANVNYDYNQKYFLTATMALDASSRFGKETDDGVSVFGVTWGAFPSANAAWLLTSEKFMHHLPFISFGKIRAGYGLTGNDAIPDYESAAYLTSVRFTDRANGLVLSHYENEKIQWEVTRRMNAGVDLGLFKNRISLIFDIYSSQTDHLLIQQNLPETLGTGLYWTNGGSLENKGYEVSADFKVLNLNNVKWNLAFSVGHYKNKIKSLVNNEGYFITDVYEGQVITQTGSAAGLFYGYKTNGVLATEAEAAEANLKQSAGLSGSYNYFEAGDIRFEEVLKDGIIDENDKQVIGDPNPDIYGNINTTIAYKRLKLDALFTYSLGNDVYNYYRRVLETGSDFSNQSKAMLNRWVAEGQQTTQPRSVYGDPMCNSRFSDRWIEDGSYLKIKNVTLSYEIPIKNNYIRGLNVWATVSNLVTFTNYLGHDPEFSAGNSVLTQGVDAGFMPLTRSYYLGVRIDL
ncbi:MAG: SusC/RagA family TonB-linked outer membrane protein [Marinilabiliaceae bacterium]|nr:SusC/RagA family TonB-linked outer membrane protein [Marinilabiliaceae bacterium]MBN2819104.1 SusC/RagA family TonB-linked outer membrane protein [Bacteroidales bacterium]